MPPPSPDEPGEQPDLAAFSPEVSEEQIRALLLNIGDGLHAVVGVGELDWVTTETDLDRMAGPLARIMNRYPALAAAAGHSDELAVSIGAGLWTWRSLLERRAVLRTRRRDEPEPEPTPQSMPGAGGGPSTPENYVTMADRLRATRQPDEET